MISGTNSSTAARISLTTLPNLLIELYFKGLIPCLPVSMCSHSHQKKMGVKLSHNRMITFYTHIAQMYITTMQQRIRIYVLQKY